MKNKQKYSFKEYNKKYIKLFEKEKNRILKLIPSAEIEHVGSTSIPGLGGKPIVDLMIIVPKNKISLAKKILEKNNYFHPEKGSEKDRIFFQKDYGFLIWKRRVHVHLTSKNTLPYLRAISFREYMKKNPKYVKEYARIKKKGAEIAKGDGQKYRDYKNKFLEKITKKALKEYENK